MVRFSVYDSVKNHFEKTGGGAPVPVYKLAIAGSIAGAAGGREQANSISFRLEC